MSGVQDQKRTNDQIATGVAIVVFWPAAFLVGGDGPTAAELAQLKGQMVAIEQAALQKNCGIQFQRTATAGEPAAVQVVTAPAAAPPPPSKGKKVAAAKGGQARAPQAAPPPVVAPAPVEMEPTLSDADRTMNSRN